MCHRLETANKFYNINKRRKKAARAVSKLKEIRERMSRNTGEERPAMATSTATTTATSTTTMTIDESGVST